MLQANKIYNMNCLDGLILLNDECVDLTVTSPPYDNLRMYDGYSLDFHNIAKELYRVTKPGGVLVWIIADATENGSETGTSFRQTLYFMECGFNLHDTMIWLKDTSVFPDKSRYGNCFEYMFVFSKGKPKTFNPICDRKNKYAGTNIHGTYREKNGEVKSRSDKWKKSVCKEYGKRFNVWEQPTEKVNKTGHPAVFPEKLANDHIISWSNKGDLVLDPFMGSGTTAKMALLNSRNYIGFEISKQYCDIAEKRIAEATKQMSIFDFM